MDTVIFNSLAILCVFTLMQAAYGLFTGLAVIVHRDKLTTSNRYGVAMSLATCFGYIFLTLSWVLEQDWLKYTPLELLCWLILHAITATVVVIYHETLLKILGYSRLMDSWKSADAQERVRKHGFHPTTRHHSR